MRFLTTSVLVIAVSCFLSAVPDTFAQEVTAAYRNNTGSIVKYRVTDGAQIARIQRVYVLNGVTYQPTHVAVADNSAYYIVFGHRFLARVRAADAGIVWLVDGSVMSGYVRYPISDIGVSSDGVFVSNTDPGGRVARFRSSDGGLVWSISRAVQIGNTICLPLRLGVAGTDSIFVALGAKRLAKLQQSDGRTVWEVDVSLTIGMTTWGVGDLAVGGGHAYLSNVDPSGTIRKFSALNGAVVWKVMRTHRVGTITYLPTRMAAVGADPVMVVFGDRYLFRIRASDGQMLFVKDIGLTTGWQTDLVADVGAIAQP